MSSWWGQGSFLILCCGTLWVGKKGSTIAKGSWLFSCTPPPWASWMDRRQPSWGEWQGGVGDILLKHKERRETRQLLPWQGSHPWEQRQGTQKEWWEGLRKVSQLVWELLTRNTHTLSGRKRSMEAHTHVCKHPLSFSQSLINRNSRQKGIIHFFPPPLYCQLLHNPKGVVRWQDLARWWQGRTLEISPWVSKAMVSPLSAIQSWLCTMQGS